MKFMFGRILIAVALVFLIGACSQGNAVEIGEKAPDFTLTDLDGKTVKLSDFSGKAIILDFFASWCPPCREEVPGFIELQKSYGPRGLSVIGISLVSLREAKEFAAKFGINYPVLIDDGKAGIAYGPIRSIPTTFVISKDFKIVKIYIGYKPKEVFENDIKELINS